MTNQIMDSKNLSINQVLTRGVEQVLPDVHSLAKLMAERKIRLYLGIDPTGSKLTLGHAVVLRKLQQFADLGHQVILLVGNGTVKIGDPTGRDSTRPELTDATITSHFKDWKTQASKVLDFDKIEIRHNGDWLDKMTLPDVIKLMAKTTVQQLLERDMFVERQKKNLPIHGHEIMYPMLQAIDSVVMDVDLEIGGSDQLFNMMMGRTLQKMEGRKKWVLTTPIINGLDGRKMSKSYGNYIALTENPLDMYGKLMRISDEQIIPYFIVLTDVPNEEIDRMKKAMSAGENPMIFKKQLAYTITSWLHNKESADRAQAHFANTVQADELPSEMPKVKIEGGASLITVLKACPTNLSGSELRRLVEQKGVELIPTGERPTDLQTVVNLEKVQAIRIGKRQYFSLQKK